MTILLVGAVYLYPNNLYFVETYLLFAIGLISGGSLLFNIYTVSNVLHHRTLLLLSLIMSPCHKSFRLLNY